MAITANPITATPPTATRPTAMQISAGGGGEVCRNVSNFNGVDSYAEFDNDIVLTGDFEIHLDTFGETGSGAYFFADSDGTDGRIAYASSGDVIFTGDSGQTLVNTGMIVGDEDRLFIFKRVSGVFSVEFGGNTYENLTPNNTDISLDSIGRVWGSASSIPWINGKVANVKMWNGDSATGTLIVDLPMDEGVAGQTGAVNYVNQTGNTDYNTTGYNITVEEECEVDTSAWNDPEDWNDDEDWVD